MNEVQEEKQCAKSKTEKNQKVRRKRELDCMPSTHNIKKGRRSPGEHSRFNKACESYNKDWRKISESVKARTTLQVRTHNQKLKAAKNTKKHKEKQEVIHDFLLRKEEEMNERLKTIIPPTGVRRVSASKELIEHLESLFGSIHKPFTVITEEHIKLLGLHMMKQKVILSPSPANNDSQILANTDLNHE